MKRIRHFLLVFLLLSVTLSKAQTLYLYQGAVTYVGSAAEVGEMIFTQDGTALQINGFTFPLSQMDSLVVHPETNVVNDVRVIYSESSARVFIPLSLSSLVTASVSSSDVTVTSSATGGDDIYYTLSGSSNNGSFLLNGSYKCRLRLAGLTLNSNKGAAVSVQNGKRIDVELVNGTVNTLSDAAGGTQKACFFVKGHPEFSGAGELNLVGRAKHAFASDEYTKIKKTTGTIRVTEAASDAFHCGQYFEMNGGNVLVEAGVKGDGIQVERTKDATDEMNGQLLIRGGNITMTISGDDVKGLKCDSALTVTGGTLNLTASGAGSRGISTGTDFVMNETDGPASITVKATGGVYTNPLDKTDTSKCMGIRVEGNMTVSAGTITVTATGVKAKTIKVVGLYTKTGTAVVNAANMDI